MITKLFSKNSLTYSDLVNIINRIDENKKPLSKDLKQLVYYSTMTDRLIRDNLKLEKLNRILNDENNKLIKLLNAIKNKKNKGAERIL